MSTPTAVTDPVAAPGSPKRPRGLLGAVAGSTMEVFDFTIYNTFAPFFAAAFFVASPGNTTGAFLQSLAVLAVGFIARPLGSLLFGHISDTRGRRVSLYLTSLTALLGTLLIALSPTHDTIGIGAAICRSFAKAGADVAFTHWTSYDTGMYGSAATEVEVDEFTGAAKPVRVDIQSGHDCIFSRVDAPAEHQFFRRHRQRTKSTATPAE